MLSLDNVWNLYHKSSVNVGLCLVLVPNIVQISKLTFRKLFQEEYK